MGRKGAFYSLMDKNLKSSVISMQKKQMIFCEFFLATHQQHYLCRTATAIKTTNLS